MNMSKMTAGIIRSAIRSCEDRIALFHQRLNKPHYSGKKTLKKQMELEEVKIAALRCLLIMNSLEEHISDIQKTEDGPPTPEELVPRTTFTLVFGGESSPLPDDFGNKTIREIQEKVKGQGVTCRDFENIKETP